MNNDLYSAGDIAKEVNLDRSTVIRHLHNIGYQSTMGKSYQFSYAHFKTVSEIIKSRMGQGKRNDMEG